MLTVRYYIEAFFGLIFFPVTAVARWLNDRRTERFQQELRLAQLAADAQKAVLIEFADVMRVTMKETAEASKEQAKVLTEWLNGFKTVSVPSSTVVTESDEARMERNRLRAQGFPVELSGQEQLEWLYKEMEKTE
jgi:hypothetical protein